LGLGLECHIPPSSLVDVIVAIFLVIVVVAVVAVDHAIVVSGYDFRE